MSSQEPIQGTPVTDVDPPNKCETWKSAYAQRLTTKKTGEEFEYFTRAFQRNSPLRGSGTLLYGLAHAYKMTNADDLRDNEKQAKELPKDSKLCIVGAGMTGLYIAMILDELNLPNLSYDILEDSDRMPYRIGGGLTLFATAAIFSRVA